MLDSLTKTGRHPEDNRCVEDLKQRKILKSRFSIWKDQSGFNMKTRLKEAIWKAGNTLSKTTVILEIKDNDRNY